MDLTIVWIIIFSALGGVLSVLAAAGFLLLPASINTRLLGPLVSFAIGALLGAAFLAVLPHALEGAGEDAAHRIPLVVLVGVLAFFLLEKLVLWRHCHIEECEVHGSTHAGESGPGHDWRPDMPSTIALAPHHSAAAGNLILIGDAIHNLVDGVLIGAAFLTDIHLGVVTSLAVIAHEIPQELGDFAILLSSGFGRIRALFYNALSGLTTIVGGVAAYYSLPFAEGVVPYVLALAAASFIYIAVADLIPGLHRRPEFSATAQQLALIAAGVGVIWLAHATLH